MLNFSKLKKSKKINKSGKFDNLDKLEPPRIVDLVLLEAAERKASDIYWLPGKEHYTIRFRVNGIQEDFIDLKAINAHQCTTRMKIMSQLQTYQNRVSQDGVIADPERYPGLEFRVAVMPTVDGERVTIRLLDHSNAPQSLDELNLPDTVTLKIRKMLNTSSGMIVLTGPTGCGKTTTIYAMIHELLKNNQDPASIISIEDPVESRIEEISQVSLSKTNEEWNYTNALRAALRQDVKTLVIGEMRDRDVVKVALDAALTGHRVITTYHAVDIPSVYARILHQGFEPFLVASAITGIVNQRLVRTLDGTARIPLSAIMIPDDEWKDFIIDNPGLSKLRRKIKEYPEADLFSAAEKMAKEGLIDPKEAILI